MGGVQIVEPASRPSGDPHGKLQPYLPFRWGARDVVLLGLRPYRRVVSHGKPQLLLKGRDLLDSYYCMTA
jgi:hypothetical protein